MQRIYHKWYSPTLNKDMELLEFGHGGIPVLVFPTSKGKFYEYEDRGMIGALWHSLEAGRVHLFCVDSVDVESWYNRSIWPGDRIWRHVLYERYLMNEVIPLIRHKNWDSRLCVTGCSFGGYHAVNFAMRHPDWVTSCVSMGGAYDLHSFMRGYHDMNFYYNQPLDFLPNLTDHNTLEKIRRVNVVLATGEHDICLDDNIRLSQVMSAKALPHLLDIWGNRTGHDWPWWQQMAKKFFP
jgi:esterase/lipase superfamily enzyme